MYSFAEQRDLRMQAHVIGGPTVENDLTVPFVGVSMMMTATLGLFYCRGKVNCTGTRTSSFLLLMLGELLLFPWHSPLDWLKLAMIAGTNFVLGIQNDVLDGIAEWLRRFLRRPPGAAPPSGMTPSVGDDSATEGAHSVSSGLSAGLQFGTIQTWSSSPMAAVLRRMFWPDLPV
jgi:hypothetical protein